MARYGLARGSVDKVVRALCDRGLLVSTKGSGTYVVTAADRRDVSVFIVLNRDVACMNDSLMEREWSFIIGESDARTRCTLIGSHEIDRYLPALRANPAARLIWNRPSTRSHAAIAALHEEGRLQILTNRPIPRYNFVASSVRPALREALEHVRRTRPDATLAVLPPYLNPEEHYLAEREIHFYELAVELGFRLITLPRTDTVDQGGTIRIAREAIAKRPNVLYVPDYYMTPYVLTLIRERGLAFGREITLIASDWNEAPGSTPGMICIRQRWRRMFGDALAWALEERPGRLQRRIPSEMTVNPV
jgi:hypothetical protein